MFVRKQSYFDQLSSIDNNIMKYRITQFRIVNNLHKFESINAKQ